MKKTLLTLLVIVMFCLSGCGDGDISQLTAGDVSQTVKDGASAVKDGVTDAAGSVADGYDRVVHHGIPEMLYEAGMTCKRWAPVVIIGSIGAGILLLEVFRKNAEIRKFALTVLIVKVPGITFLFVYVYAFLYGMLN